MALVEKAFGDIITFTRASSGGRVNASGQFEWVGTNVPRLTYDPVTLQPLGLLVEEQRTNSLTQSETFGIAPWVADDATIGTRAVGITPLFETANSNFHRIGRTGIPITSGQSVTLSIRVKKLGRRYIYIRESLVDGVVLVNTGFDFDTASVGFTPAGRTVAVTPAQDGSFIISITATSTATNTLVGLYIGSSDVPVVSNSIPVFFGDVLQGVGLGDTQLEVGSSASSYIPTEATQVTRAADVASVNTLSPWYNPMEGTLVVEFVRSRINICGFAGFLGAANSMIALESGIGAPDLLRMRVLDAGVSVATPNASNTSVAGVRYKMAGSYKANAFAASVNGSTPGTDSSGTVPAVTSLRIGRALDGAQGSLNGTISSITYYPRVIDVQQASA